MTILTKPFTAICAVLLAFSLFLSLGCAAGHVDAQDNTPAMSNQQLAKRIADRLHTEVGLNQEQYQQVYQLNLKYIPEMDRILDSKEFRIKKDRKLREIELRKDNQYREILTDEQYQKYLKMKDQIVAMIRDQHPDTK
ncbi:hypothetical protein KS4_09140 [Poriferisphaera corsica]|uniref:Uncharacterized protein n=1 Tax=Poriferisphaera corsica TaxID=2528020 RepID=A0A517YRM0_9BACT|nr:hypothetical protein [Poriferisphaera corsica]QDU32875.1 hypothetical protein KS4_09140 [Poriferisphaera corsica]